MNPYKGLRFLNQGSHISWKPKLCGIREERSATEGVDSLHLLEAPISLTSGIYLKYHI